MNKADTITTPASIKRKADKPDKPDSHGMDYLQSLPRRWVTMYIPIILFVFVLLFPFYWMAITAFKPDAELLSQSGNPFWVIAPTLAHFKKLLFNTPYPEWMLNTVIVSTVATFTSLAAIMFSYFGLQRRGWQQGGDK